MGEIEPVRDVVWHADGEGEEDAKTEAVVHAETAADAEEQAEGAGEAVGSTVGLLPGVFVRVREGPGERVFPGVYVRGGEGLAEVDTLSEEEGVAEGLEQPAKRASPTAPLPVGEHTVPVQTPYASVEGMGQ